jgi:hypothetical protein
MITPTVIVGSPVTVASLPTATAPAVDDYLILDGATNGTRKILGSDVAVAGSNLQSRVETVESRLAAAEMLLQQIKDLG